MAAPICPSPSGVWLATVRGDLAILTASDPSTFPNWCGFLPTPVSHDDEHEALYVKTRSTHNKSFFDDTRAHILGCAHTMRLHMVAGEPSSEGTGMVPAGNVAAAARAILQGLSVAKGFLASREQYKALTLCQLCVDLADHLPDVEGGATGLFWQLLGRLQLGDMRAKFRRLDEAEAVLQEAVRLCDEERPLPWSMGARETVIQGACLLVLGRVHLDRSLLVLDKEAEHQELLRLATEEVENAVRLLEAQLPEVPGYADRRRDAAVAVATAYSSRGVCDVRAGNFEASFEWFTKARDAVQEYSKEPGSHGHRLLQEVDEQLLYAKHLHMYRQE